MKSTLVSYTYSVLLSFIVCAASFAAAKEKNNQHLFFVNEKMKVKGKALFKNNVVMNKNMRVHGKSRFYNTAEFKGGIAIEGELSIEDTIIGCDVTVGCNINMHNSTDAAHGNIIKDGKKFIHNTGTNNTFVGVDAGNFTVSGTGNNVGLGASALMVNLTGQENVAVGAFALANNTIGSGNIAVGFSALNANTTSMHNVAIGTQALQANTSGSDNIAIGATALHTNVVGQSNIAIGASALENNTAGSDNVAIGSNALSQLSNGTNNTAVGFNAGSATVNSNDSNNIFIGAHAGSNITGSNSNIMIDNIGGANDTSTTRIGTTQTKCFIAGIRGITTTVANAIPVLIDSAGQLGTISSSERFKHSIQYIVDESAAILKLNPVSFIYNSDELHTRQFGLIAEDVEKVFPKLVIKDPEGAPFTVRYEVLPVLLLNEVKKLVSELAVLTERVKLLEDNR